MKKLFATINLFILLFACAYAQEQDSMNVASKEELAEVKGALEGMNETVLEMKSTLDALKKIKVSGYIQAQYQSAQTDGAKSFAGGDFPSTLNNRIMIRRGRIKFTYDNTSTQYVLQLDASEKGLGIKDAYITMKEPWLNTFGLTAGVFDRPFGFEIGYSSSARETPERSRLFQTLFPGERDLGAKIEIAPQGGPLSIFNLKAGLFAGNGIAVETDNYKDFIGRLGLSLPFEEINLAIDAGISGYFGKVRLDDKKKVYEINGLTSIDSSQSNKKGLERTYIGGDIQVYYDLPVLGGFSLRGEYIQGKQPGTSSGNSAYKAGGGDLYMREFSGYYLCYVQNVGDLNQFVLKYDVYDPNTKISGSEIGLSNKKITLADLKYSTLGLGWIYYYDSNIKFVLYYDMVSNEKVAGKAASSFTAYKEDLKDNVLTFRIQYKF